MATGDSTHPGHGTDHKSGPDDQLTDTDTGRWQITTHTAIYLIDLDARTMLRVPGSGLEHGLNPAHGEVYVTSDLPGDHTSRPLLQLVRCQLGHPMWLLHRGDRPEMRISTPVLEIRRLAPRASGRARGHA